MGYDFAPKRKEAGDFHLGAFSWPWMLDEGLGLPIGYESGFVPGSFFYVPDRRGLCPTYNDGFEVTARQARDMAKVARWLVERHRSRVVNWNALPEADRAKMEADQFGTYKNLPIREDFIDKLERFAEWAERSGGFRIW